MSTVRTIQGDFYDLITYRQFGSEYYMTQLIEANLDFYSVVRFNAGAVLTLPEVEPEPIQGLAPWRRVVRLR
jgi:phage tail protein X